MRGKKGLYFIETSQNSELENVQVRYAGAFMAPWCWNWEFGAGIRVKQSSISLKNSIIAQNINNGLRLTNSASIIDSVQVLDNMGSTYDSVYGKGIYVEGGSPTIANSDIARNYYGLYLSDWYDEANGITVPATPSIENTDYINNTIPCTGSGFCSL